MSEFSTTFVYGVEKRQEANMEDQERGGGLRALDGKESGRNAAC